MGMYDEVCMVTGLYLYRCCCFACMEAERKRFEESERQRIEAERKRMEERKRG